MTSYIYKITNLVNGKTYVGQYTGVKIPFKYYMGGGTVLRQAIKKYGKANFKKEIIIEGEFNKELLNSMEIHYIQLYSPALTANSYNLDKGGSSGSVMIKPVLQYTLDGQFIKMWNSAEEASIATNTYITNIISSANDTNISANNFLWLYNEENLQKKLQRLYNFKNGLSKENVHKHNIYIYDNNEWKIFKGTVKAAEFLGGNHAQVLRCINTEKGYHWYKGILVSNRLLETIPESEYLKRKPIVHKKINQYTLDGILIKTWEDKQELINAFNGKTSGIYKACSGGNKTGYGFIWQYA